ncbi:glycerol-3-phosphate 1-O-acyltransferase PlsY [Metamycoplasma hyosynoviae]|uniref:glycerol-3-phosphate 1-O-acyltransferase PlsY n=1 Tax=Metamycoplasma hyosynoviae TaxID=29559 RepID=UPI0023596E1B|nr:glycerol-3-phosphate 1-O-acyltransferase PlsY [Metamycoplasma hyosynoviae]MDC8926899.1 glycerol-3-phosphate 1-O-acyltransferase PlsY [Metamycoplasma hyosynoviae]
MKFNFSYIWINLIIFLCAYLIGSINLSIILSKYKNKDDIRTKGSGNPGSTNAFRNFGAKFGIIVFLFDFLKSYISIIIVFLFKQFLTIYDSNFNYILPLIAGLGVMLGHIFPIYFKFKGGKGVASFFGILLAFDFVLFLIGVILFFTILLIGKMVSLSSVISTNLASFISFIPFFYFWPLGFIHLNTPFYVDSVILVIDSATIMLTHIPNYFKISDGHENKVNLIKYFKNKKNKEIVASNHEEIN